MWVLQESRFTPWVSYLNEDYHERFFLSRNENFPPSRHGDSWYRTGNDMSPWTRIFGFPRVMKYAPRIYCDDNHSLPEEW